MLCLMRRWCSLSQNPCPGALHSESTLTQVARIREGEPEQKIPAPACLACVFNKEAYHSCPVHLCRIELKLREGSPTQISVKAATRSVILVCMLGAGVDKSLTWPTHPGYMQG